jgi:hypothetical protein
MCLFISEFAILKFMVLLPYFRNFDERGIEAALISFGLNSNGP